MLVPFYVHQLLFIMINRRFVAIYHDKSYVKRVPEVYKRQLRIDKLLERKSFFLFGPRSVGKSTLIKQQLPGVQVYDLLDASTVRALSRNPSLIGEVAHGNDANIVAIDEIQKLPSLLDEVHRLIENRGLTFLLTGSSARKLRRGGTNLLAGRAWWAELLPLTFCEIPDFDLISYLNTGGLPHIYRNPEYVEELNNYVSLYLQQEIMAEALTRNVSAFSTFLEVMALSNGEEISFESLSSDCGVSAATIKNYLSILTDTLLGFEVPSYRKTKKRKAIARSKYFLFDIGVVNVLASRGKIVNKSELFGKAFEHFIGSELRAYMQYTRMQSKLQYWRSTSQFEVDFVVDNQVAIEVKASNMVQAKHLKGLRALKEEQQFKSYVVVSTDPVRRITDDGIVIYPWQSFLSDLWSGKIIE